MSTTIIVLMLIAAFGLGGFRALGVTALLCLVCIGCGSLLFY